MPNMTQIGLLGTAVTGNPGFLAKAPKEKVDAEKEKLSANQAKLAAVRARLDELK